MKSVVKFTYDLKKAVEETAWDITPDEQKIRDALHQVAIKYGSYQSVDIAQKGDILSLNLKSDNKRYNRQLKLNIGSGLFDKELEANLVGKSKGKTYAVKLTAAEVEFEILEISRMAIPSLTDEMAKNEGVDGVDTVEALRSHFAEIDFREQLNVQLNPFIEDYLGKCSFEICEEDIVLLDEWELERCRAIAKDMGLVFDEMKGEQMQGAVGCEDIEEFKTMIHRLNSENLKMALLGAPYANIDTSAMNQNEMYDAMDAFVVQIGKFAFACR